MTSSSFYQGAEPTTEVVTAPVEELIPASTVDVGGAKSSFYVTGASNVLDVVTVNSAQEAADEARAAAEEAHGHEGTAQAAAAEAAASAVAAAGSATASATSAAAAHTSETNAAASASSAASSAASAAAIYDNFDDRYLGPKASTPLTDNDGDPLLDGALYWNTTTHRMVAYDGGTDQWYELLSVDDQHVASTTVPAVDNTLARFDGATGRLIQSSGVTLDDGNIMNGLAAIGVPIILGGISATQVLENRITNGTTTAG